MLKLHELIDFSSAIERWEYGDPGPVAAYIVKHGITTDHERQQIARMLTTKPDPRTMVKPVTIAILRDVKAGLRHREEIIRVWPEAALCMTAGLQALSTRLAKRGWDQSKIQRAVKKHRPHLLSPKVPTVVDVFREVAARYRVDVGAVQQAWKRYLHTHGSDRYISALALKSGTRSR